jgi:predicted molibdopterin-dependent oxidoreductase YjgC
MNRKVRLTKPLIRRDGVLTETTWDDALSAAARRLNQIRSEHGGEALGLFSCSKATNETNYLAQKLARAVLGTNNIDSCNRT